MYVGKQQLNDMWYSVFTVSNVLYSRLQPPAKTTARLWRCPSTRRRWAWSSGCAPAAWSSSSFCWVPSSSSLRKGKRLLIKCWARNMPHYAQSHRISRIVFSLYVLLWNSSAVGFQTRWTFGKVMLAFREDAGPTASAALFSFPHGAPEGPNNSHLRSLSECEVFN